jgi:hypothetical protein
MRRAWKRSNSIFLLITRVSFYFVDSVTAGLDCDGNEWSRVRPKKFRQPRSQARRGGAGLRSAPPCPRGRCEGRQSGRPNRTEEAPAGTPEI